MSVAEARERFAQYLAPFPSQYRLLLQAAAARAHAEAAARGEEGEPGAGEPPESPRGSGILQEGWLFKLGGGKGGRRSWKRRWVVVWGKSRSYTCYYYKTDGPGTRDPRKAKGSMVLVGYGVCAFDEAEEKQLGPFGIRLLASGDAPDAAQRHSGRRTWFVRAAGTEEQAEWIHAFSLAATSDGGGSSSPRRRAFTEAYRRLRDSCVAPPNPGPRPGLGGTEQEHLTALCLDRVAVDLGMHLETAVPDAKTLDIVAAAHQASDQTCRSCQKQAAVVLAEARDAVDLQLGDLEAAEQAVRLAFVEHYSAAVDSAWETLQHRVRNLLQLLAPPVAECVDAVVAHSRSLSKEVVEIQNQERWNELTRRTSAAFAPLTRFPSPEEWGCACSEMAHWGVLAEVRRAVSAFIEEARGAHHTALRSARLPSAALGSCSPRGRSLALAHKEVAARREAVTCAVLVTVAVRAAGPPMSAVVFAMTVTRQTRMSVFAAAAASDSFDGEDLCTPMPQVFSASLSESTSAQSPRRAFGWKRPSLVSTTSPGAGLCNSVRGTSFAPGLCSSMRGCGYSPPDESDERAAALAAAVPSKVDGVVEWRWIAQEEVEKEVRKRCEAEARLALAPLLLRHRDPAAGSALSTPEQPPLAGSRASSRTAAAAPTPAGGAAPASAEPQPQGGPQGGPQHSFAVSGVEALSESDGAAARGGGGPGDSEGGSSSATGGGAVGGAPDEEPEPASAEEEVTEDES